MKIGIADEISATDMHFSLFGCRPFEEDLDGGQIFEDYIANELKLFVVFALVVLVYLGSQRSQDVLHA